MSDSPDAQLQRALQAHREGDLASAYRLYADILRTEPGNFDARYLTGLIHVHRREWEDAARVIGEALKVIPTSLDALYHRGHALQNLQRYEEALASYDAGLLIRAGIPEFIAARAGVLTALGRHAEAIADFDRALAQKSDLTDAWLGRGYALLMMEQPAEALASFDRALALRPDLAEAWNNRGNALAMLKRMDEALRSYDRVIALRPRDVNALNHRAITLFEMKLYSEAVESFARLLTAEPKFPFALGNLAYSRLHCCDWRDYSKLVAEIAAGLAAGERVITPMQNTALSETPEAQLQASRIWVADGRPVTPHPLWRGERYRHDRIRVAYLSADFHSHATAALMAGVFEHHDRERFEVFAISYGPDDKSEMRARLLAAFEHFIDVKQISNEDVARILRENEIDIAVDLKGYSQDARPGILAFRPAPVQAHYLGFPGTMGAQYVDYLIADAIVVPQVDASFYSEAIAYLPETYQCNDTKRRIAERPLTRTEAGLPENGFVFCCFNNSYKIAPEIFAIWMRLLAAREGSVLWLLDDNPAAVASLRREAEAHRIAPGRLVFAPRADLDYHLARQQLADLFLDTLPCNAHTSASDALWAGLPVLTCLGTSFAGRVAASLNCAIGLAEMTVPSLEAYETFALELSDDPARLASLKAKLRANRGSSPLFDTKRATQALESAYRTMWERAERGESPITFTVE